MRRSELREHIFKVLFEIEFTDSAEYDEQLDLYLEDLEDASEKDRAYISWKVKAIAEKIPELDQIITENTRKWKTNRMNKVDLTILRLAVFEMRMDEDVPDGVAINEAVEIAKKYSSDQGPAFVNAVLGKVAGK